MLFYKIFKCLNKILLDYFSTGFVIIKKIKIKYIVGLLLM